MGRNWIRCGAALAASLVLATAWGASVWGKTLLRSDDLSPEVLGRFALFNAKPRDKAGMLVATEDWKGDVLTVSSKTNPYRIVVTVSGVAESAGEVSARVDTGWGLDSGMSRINPAPHVRKQDVQPGERVQLVTASGPISFKDDRSVVPEIAYAGSSNLKIDGMRVEVWAGLGKTSFLQGLQSWLPLLTGIVFLGLAIWWRRR
jgi:hypothetical protein